MDNYYQKKLNQQRTEILTEILQRLQYGIKHYLKLN
jgi:hypothetical protein